MREQGGSGHRLVEFMTAVGRCPTVQDAIGVAAQLVAEEFDAEVGAVVLDGALVAQVGFGLDEPPSEVLLGIRPGLGTQELPGIGDAHTLGASWEPARLVPGGRLLVARTDDPFDLSDRTLVLGMVGALGLTLDMIAALERERGRQQLLEVLLGVQRAISTRTPLPAILAEVTRGASTVLGGRAVSLVLDDAAEPGRPIVTGDAGPVDGPCHRVAIRVNGQHAGELVAAVGDGHQGEAEREVLDAFAGHAGMALSDARAVEALAEAYRDPLTGLPNRSLFLDRLTDSLRRGGPPAPSVLFIDLDRFKAVNDTLGHAAGDELLRAVSRRLLHSTRPEDTVARFGGDEFALLVTGASEHAQVLRVAERLIASLQEPFPVAGELAWIGATIGIAHAHGGGADDCATLADDLLADADVAMYAAKKAGGGRSAVYEPGLRAALVQQLELRTELQQALVQGQLDVHYQPVVDLASRRVVGVEALARWNHPTRGSVPPAEFIPVAEASGFIVDIGRWVLRRACAQAARWRRDEPGLLLSVNVSPHQLRDHGFVADVEAALESAGLPGTALTLEITESVLVDDDRVVLSALADLRRLGVRVALDDFGTGFSVLGYLSRLPVDVLKIDRSFVAGVGDPRGRQLVRTVIDLGRAFELEVVAEGVEDEHQAALLEQDGCRFAQGYHFARPGETAAVTALLRHDRALRSPLHAAG